MVSKEQEVSLIGVVLAGVLLCWNPDAFAQNHMDGQAWPSHLKIARITVENPLYVLPPTTEAPVNVINAYGGLATLADEHSTIFPPGTLPGHDHDYLFFVPTTTALNTNTNGLVVLTGGSGPNEHGQWTLDFASDYDHSPVTPVDGVTNGQIFISPFQRQLCPKITRQHPQDTTFDLNYANGGSVIIDPTNWGSTRLLMIYEGTTLCINVNGGMTTNAANSFYSTLGVATSEGYGKVWPAYRAHLTDLPGQSTKWGPAAPEGGAFGSLVCGSNDCSGTPSPNFGRYPVLSPPYSIGDAVASAQPLSENVADSAPSAFVDDVHPWSGPYVYTVQNYLCPADIALCHTSAPNDVGIITVARARLNGGAPLSFEKWYNGSFRSNGIGGDESPIFPEELNATPADFSACRAASQVQSMGSINYVEETPDTFRRRATFSR